MPKKNLTDLRDIFFDEVHDIAREDPNFVFLTVDMGANLMEDFRKEFPDRCINVGISEQNAVLTATGLVMSGKRVFVYGITSFLILRALEQIKLDVCYAGLPVTIAGIGTGFTYGTDGPTHYAIDDVSTIGSLPEIEIYCPCDGMSTRALTRRAYEIGRPVYLRLEKGTRKQIYSEDKTFENNMTLLRKGDHLMVSTGVMIERVLEVADTLNNEGYSVGVLDVYKLKPLDWVKLDEYMKNVKSIYTIEEHVLHGGLGGIVSTYLCDQKLFIPRRQFGVARKILLQSRTRERMLEVCGLDKKTLLEEIRKEIKNVVDGPNKN